MFEGLLTAAARHPRWATLLVVGGVVGFAFWEPLFAGATLAPLDLIEATGHPQRAYRELGSVTDRASGDLVNIHAHWTSFGRIVRGVDGWWDPAVAQGYPVMKGGLPLFALTYVVFPAWFAAGAMTVTRTIAAWLFTTGWLRCFGLRRSSTLVAGMAYAFSGYLVGWGGWPHANVAAFAPALLWGVERLLADRSLRNGVPIGVVLALMIWSNSPLATAYVLIGVAGYTLVRVAVSHGRDAGRAIAVRLPAAVVAGVVGMGLAAPHLVFFAEWLDWADTSHRRFSADSAAGIDYLLTAAFPAAFGTDGHGPAFFATGNWIEFQTFVGVSVLIVAAFAPAAASGPSDGAIRRRGAVLGLWILVLLGALVAYVGGPVTQVAQDLMGDVSGLATRAKVLISLGFAGLVGFGFEAWIDPSAEAATARRRTVRWILGGVVIVGLAMVPALLRWSDLVAEAGVRREIAVVAIPHLVAGFAVLAVFVAGGRRWLPAPGIAVLLAVTIAAELLWFARPIPTVFDADEVFAPLAEHELVLEELEPGERLAGSYQTFWPSSTQAFGIPSLGGQTLKSPGYQALLRAVDPLIFDAREFGTPAYPSIPPRISPALSVWDAFGVGVWSTAPSHAPVGIRTEPALGFAMDDVARAELHGELVVPEGGLRAVLVDALIESVPGRIEMIVEVGGERIETWMPHDEVWPTERHALAVPVVGETLPPGETATVTVRSTGEPRAFLVGVTLEGTLSLGAIGGVDDGLEMLSTGAVTMLHNTDAAPFRLHDAAVVEAELDAAARLVVDRPTLERSFAVVETDLGLPVEPDPAADLRIREVDVAATEVRATVSTDRTALLVAPVPVYPGWTATVDGEPAEIVTVDTTFAAVVVPAGVSEVEMVFAPDGLGRTSATFVVALLGAAAVWWWPVASGRRLRRRAGAPA